MPINIKTQKDSVFTEVTISLPADLNELDQLMRASKATGKIVATYNQGGMLGVNIEQKARVSQAKSEEVRKIVGVGDKELQ